MRVPFNYCLLSSKRYLYLADERSVQSHFSRFLDQIHKLKQPTFLRSYDDAGPNTNQTGSDNLLKELKGVKLLLFLWPDLEIGH